MNAPKEEDFYNSRSEGKEYKDYDEKYDAYIQATCEETFGKENCYEETFGKENCYEETYRQETYDEYDEEFWEEYYNNTEEKKNNSQEI